MAKRIPSDMTAGEVGVAQIQVLSKSRPTFGEVLDIVSVDGHYGNANFLRPLQGQCSGVVARLRRDRALYRPPTPPRRGLEDAPRYTENALPLRTLIAGGHPMSSMPSSTRNSDR